MPPQTAEQPAEIPEAVEDSMLQRLATPLAEDLLPSLKQPRAFYPLLAVLALVPGLHSLNHRELTNADAAWGLRALEVVQAHSWVDRVLPGVYLQQVPLVDQPPLGTWLTAVSMSALGAANPISLVLPSYLAASGLLVLFGMLSSRIAGPRTAVFAVLMLALHGVHLKLVQMPSPVALSMLLAVLSVWAYVSHMQDAEGAVSLRLLTGGTALGLCLLAGGPLAIVLAVVLLLPAVPGDRRPPSAARGKVTPKKRRRGFRRLRSLGVLCLTAFAVGGWWPLIVVSERPTEFLEAWIGTQASLPAGDGVTWTRHLLERLLIPAGLLSGLVCCGVRRCISVQISDSRDTLEDGQLAPRTRLLLSWLLVSGAAVLLLDSTELSGREGAGMWSAFWMLACVVTAAFGAEGIVSRATGVREALFWSVLTLATIPWVIPSGPVQLPVPEAEQALVAAVLMAVILAGTWWWKLQPTGRERRARRVLLCVLGMHLLLNTLAGNRMVQSSDVEGRDLVRFHDALQHLPADSACRFVADRTPPPRLKYIVRSVFPDTDSDIETSWTAAVSDVLSTTPGTDGHHLIVLIIWSERDSRLTTARVAGLNVRPATPPQFLQGLQLRGFLVDFTR